MTLRERRAMFDLADNFEIQSVSSLSTQCAVLSVAGRCLKVLSYYDAAPAIAA